MSVDMNDRPEGFQHVSQELQRLGHPHAPTYLDIAARTSQEAADALGVAVGQIAKSVVFRRKSDEAAVLVVTSGDRRVGQRRRTTTTRRARRSAYGRRRRPREMYACLVARE